MQIAICGAGRMGAAVARLCMNAGHRILLAPGRKSRESPKLAAIEQGVELAATLGEAVGQADIVVLALPWAARGEALHEWIYFAGKIVVDAMNPYDPYPRIADLDGALSSEIVEREIAGARVVKALNTISAWDLARDAQPPGAARRIAIPLCGNDPVSKAVVARLIDDIGFDPIDIGRLASGHLAEPDRPLFGRRWSSARLLSEYRQRAGLENYARGAVVA